MSLRIHLSGEVAPLLILALAILVDEQCHRLNREGQQGLGALLIEPLHETLLQPRETIPVGLRAIGEVELAEDALEVILVIVGYVPEYGLIVAGTSRLVQRVNNLLEIVGYHLIDGTLLQAHICLLVGTLPIVQTILLTNKVVHVHQELWSSASTTQHRANHEDHVNKTTCKRLQIGRSSRVTTNSYCTTYQPRIHGNRSTIVSQTRFVIFINEVMIQLVKILICQILAVHFLNTVCEQTTIQTDEV